MPRREHLDGRFLELDLGLFAQAREFPFKMPQAMHFAEAGAPGPGPRELIATEKNPSKKFAPFFWVGRERERERERESSARA